MVSSAVIADQTPALSRLQEQAGRTISHAIKTASAKTGVDFSYLLQQAAAESSFDTDARAKTSSARGLYQFIDKTWLNMVKKYGARHGLAQYADAIDNNGHVKEPGLKDKILALRDDPKISSYMAAEFAGENARYLEQRLDKDYGAIGATEMYFAHFLGASGATGFLNAYNNDPLATAADLFPKAARANRNVFYDSKTGKARTLAGVYDFFAKKFKASPAQPDMPHIHQNNNSLYAQSRAVNDPRFARNNIIAGDQPHDYNAFIKQAALNMLQGDNSYTFKSQTSGQHLTPFFSNLVQSPVTLMMLAETGYIDRESSDAHEGEKQERQPKTLQNYTI